uniref:Uncharacterized protein n=1 Tax=Arundo donax TaxID=35708 RepID=A0A0A9E1I7_ARUDO
MVPAAYPLNPTLKSIHEVDSFRHHKLCTVIPCTDPSTLHRQPIPILLRDNRVVELGGYWIILAGVQEGHSRWAK